MAELNLRVSSRSSITRIWTQIQEDTYDPDSIEGEQLLSSARQHFSRFLDNHLALVAAAQEGEIADHDELFAATEEIFNKICIKLKRQISQPPPPPVRMTNSGYSHAPDMRLDPVSIPSFDGEPINWLVFKDMFETLVHNRTDLDPTYKLGKLRQYVKAEKVPLIGGLYTGGYEEVWSELKRRYDNPRVLSETHVQRMLDLPTQPQESRGALTKIIDCVRNSFRALEVMGVPVQHWDAIAVPLLLPKLPTVTRTEWGMSLKSNDIPKLEELMNFVERRAANLPELATVSTLVPKGRGASHSVKAHLGTTSANVSATSASPGNCPACSEAHRIVKCRSFRTMSVDIRWELAKQSALCFNCLRSGHSTRECPSGTCTNCHQKHNTLLCRKSQQTTSTPTITTSVEATSSPNAAYVSSTGAPQVIPRKQ